MDVISLSIEKYNKYCLHYELVARSCYAHRRQMAHALSDDYFPYLISILIVFDMQRKMGQGLVQKYDKNANGFATRLSQVIERNRSSFFQLEMESIDTIDFAVHGALIQNLYDDFALNGSLDSQGHAFHVGATKVLHFLHPELFPIVDSNSAKVLTKKFNIDYNSSGQPGYTSQKYIDSMQAIQGFVQTSGKVSLQMLEPCSPITRIFDKLAFVKGADI